MISEKTVEINITHELANYIGGNPFILSPTQQREATLGYDVILNHVFIQYKRALLKNYGYRYELNKTRYQDQHLRLLVLELLGYNVFYAFPLFHEEATVIGYSGQLLSLTMFVRPSDIPLYSRNTIGHHFIKYERGTNLWTVHSTKGKKIEKIFRIDNMREMIKDKEKEYKSLIEDFNKIFFNEETLKLNKAFSSKMLLEYKINNEIIKPNRRYLGLIKHLQLLGFNIK